MTDNELPCRHRRRDRRAKYTPTEPTLREMFDRTDQRETFCEFRYWCDRCGTTLNAGRTWAM